MLFVMAAAPNEKEARIKQFAQTKAGFDDVRITTPDAPGHAERMAAWLQAQMHGAMGYLQNRGTLRAGALSDERLLADTQSVIMAALSYHPAANDYDAAAPDGAARGTVARYARGQDYHAVMWEKLKTLGGFIEGTWPGEKTRGFADSGPIRERELALRSGLGWQGKHTGLISLDLGNWFFLGALLTTLPLTPDDAPIQNHCGTCTRCLSACPTGALVAPLTLDARRCISYLTIELKGPIPPELRPLIGDRIFGCDDCLAACPWNERAQVGREMRVAGQREADSAHPDLLAWLAVCETDAAFKAKFYGTPLLRTGRDGLRRNVCVALGNVGGYDALPALAACADDPSPVVREHALWAMGQIEQRCFSPPTNRRQAV